MTDVRYALYARVSSDSQTRDHTIASQVTALRERIAADDFALAPDHNYLDEGYSGSILLRPALERLRDAVACGQVDRLYVHAPDRLARRYAHQALLIDEFRRAGVEIVFLNRPIGGTAEDDLLLQVQGVIAEYERAKILERSRRGRRHAARSGSVSALTGAPFGYRYVNRDQGGGVARFEVVEAEAHIVRLIFAWIGLDRPGSPEPAGGVPAARADGLSDAHRSQAVVCLNDPRHARQSGLYGSRCFRPGPLLAATAAAAADPWPVEAFAAGHQPRSRSCRGVDRNPRSSTC